MRHKKHQPHENHERWLVSYADFITLLFAFFVVLFASTKTDKNHARAVSQSIEKALKNGGVTPELASFLNTSAKPKATKNRAVGDLNSTRKPEDLLHSLEQLQSDMKEELKSGTVRLSLEKRGLVIELKAGAFFASGEDSVNASAMPIVARLATTLNSLPNQLRLEGHTDSQPISNSHFRSNWELSAARSIGMMRLLDERFHVDHKRMAIVGYADTAPVESNDTEQGRERNRRVDVVILNDQGMKGEPTPMASQLLSPNSDSVASVKTNEKS